MNRFKLLDCTLRDGGYINNWNFGYKIICSIIHKLIEAKIDYIELGFLRNCVYDRDITLFNNIGELKNILPPYKGVSNYSVMALHNTYDAAKLEQNDNTVDIVRVTFHDYDIDEGLLFVKKVMDKGYKVFCNPINIMGYSDYGILKLFEKINNLQPFGFSIVDTFGSMMKNDLLRIYLLVERNLDQAVQVGLHLHENLGLSYSLAQNFIDVSARNYNAVIDGSLLGMGRIPGNLCIELMMDYINQYYDGHYDTNAAYDAIDDYIVPIKEKETWGYSTAYALSAKYNLHRNYSEHLLGKGKLRVKDINQILAGVETNRKASFDEQYIEKAYLEYQNNAIDDTESKNYLKQIVNCGKKILILAPGNSLNVHKNEIEQFIKSNDPIIISANYNDITFDAQYNFYSNIRRFEQYMAFESGKTVLITSNVIKAASKKYAAFNYYDLAYDGTGLFDNCVIMLFRLLYMLEVKEVSIAGFDGFSESAPNYVYKDHIQDNKDMYKQNKAIKYYTNKLQKRIAIKFITPSYYNEIN
jgi:4-hydroxy 2-oxovalerate aldolase